MTNAIQTKPAQTEASPTQNETKTRRKPRKHEPGLVRVRVLPRGHGQVHTGKDARASIEPDEAREALTGDARLKADAEALVAASVRAGQTYARGERTNLAEKTAIELENRGFVEILDDDA